MKASRELDALVAEKVMGLEVAPDTSRYVWNEISGWIPPPPFSTDIAASWHVVNHMRGRGYRLLFTDNLIGPVKNCMFIGNGNAYSAHDGDDCMAICGAALRAFGINYEKS